MRHATIATSRRLPAALSHQERPRERLLRGGPNGLTDAELVAVCLRTGPAGVEVVKFARRLLGEFGGLRGLLEADSARLLACSGLGPAKVAALKASLALADRYDTCVLASGDVMSDTSTVGRFLDRQLAPRQREVFACLFLDARHRLLGFEELFFGSIDRANVYPRELVKRVLAHNAAAVILAHNHPSGMAEPSAADIELTRRLQGLLAELDVRLVDHFVVGRGRVVSFAERRLLG